MRRLSRPCRYYARIHLARMNAQGVIESDEVDVDARPSDAINLAVRFGVGAVAGQGGGGLGHQGLSQAVYEARTRGLGAIMAART